MLSISSLLLDACPENGYGNQATSLHMSNRPEFDKVAKEWVEKYALKPKPVEPIKEEVPPVEETSVQNIPPPPALSPHHSLELVVQ